MMIVSDIGGTYVRLARAIDGAPTDIQKYKAADFKNLGQALDEYCNGETGELLIAAAGADINGTWTITNNPQWSMEAPGWDIKLILNDFEAIAHALPALEKSDLKTLNSGNPSNTDFCVIGAGTGLGLAYYRDNKIQKTLH